ncbi:hypothetical protein H0H93_003096 [Arthromyces matolae]|nr:hypothetical protein H0H93_003096 [Arthromyces matolae]
MFTSEVQYRLPDLVNEASIYAHVLVGIPVVLTVWFGLTLATSKPPVREVPAKCIEPSLKSNTTTLVDSEARKDKDDDAESIQQMIPDAVFCEEPEEMTAEEKEYITFSNPFADVSAPVKLSRKPSLALHPFARRLSMPGREPSHDPTTPFHHVVTPLRQHATLYRHGSLSDDNDSYFPAPHVPSGKVRLIPDGEQRTVTAIPPTMGSRSGTRASIASATSKKMMKLKVATKKVKALFHRSRHL